MVPLHVSEGGLSSHTTEDAMAYIREVVLAASLLAGGVALAVYQGLAAAPPPRTSVRHCLVPPLGMAFPCRDVKLKREV